jgi:hypothetical protein
MDFPAAAAAGRPDLDLVISILPRFRQRARDFSDVDATVTPGFHAPAHLHRV